MPAPSSPTAQNRDISGSFAKGLAVLGCFDGHSPGLSLADIAKRTGQDRATARRGALTRVAEGLLRQEDRVLSLTPKILTFAGGFLQANRFGRLVQPVLNHHARTLGSEITLATLDADRVLLLAQSTVSDGPVSQGFTIGSHLPLLHTSLGRMLLACLAEDAAQELIATAPLPQHTSRSLTRREDIADRVRQTGESGVCITSGEFEPGISGVAIPAFDGFGQRMVLGSSVPGSALEDGGAQRITDQMNLAAAALRACFS